MKILDRAQETVALRLATPITARQVLLISLLLGLLAAALFTRFWRLGTPGEFYFDETQVATAARSVLDGNPGAWDFFGGPQGVPHENTHPPLSKLFIAGGMAFFGADNPFGWRFFGALAGVGSVGFIYLLGKRLFGSEIAGMAAAFLMIFEGLSFAQARIATPDAFLLFFILGSIYFVVSDRFLFSGIFFGAALATKLVALLTVFPIALYFLYRYWQTGQGKGSKVLYLAPLALLAFYQGTPVMFGSLLVDKVPPGVLVPDLSAPVFSAALGLWMAFWALAPLAAYIVYRSLRSKAGHEENALAGSLAILPLFFVVVPLSIYLLTYVPMLFTGHGLGDVILLNRDGYQFHAANPVVAGPDANHPYSSPWNTWPLMMRPVYLYSSGATIYSLGNPIIFWLGLPALGFAMWQGLSGVRAKLDEATGGFSILGSVDREQAALLFVVLTYLGFLLPYAAQPRLTFIYHYLPSLSFLMLALAYVVHRWWQRPWGRTGAVVFLAVVAVTFVYFYPHLAAVSASGAWQESYFWLPNVVIRLVDGVIPIPELPDSFFWFDSCNPARWCWR